MLVRVTRFGRHYHVDVVKQHYWGGKRRYRVLFDLGRCDDRQRRQEIREIVRDYQPLVHARVVIEEIEDVSGPLQGKGFFKKMRQKISR